MTTEEKKKEAAAKRKAQRHAIKAEQEAAAAKKQERKTSSLEGVKEPSQQQDIQNNLQPEKKQETKMETNKQASVVLAILALMNVSDKDKEKAEVEEKVELFAIEAQDQLTGYESDKSKLAPTIKKNEKFLQIEKDKLEKLRLDVSGDFAAYDLRIKNQEVVIVNHEKELKSLKEKCEALDEVIARYTLIKNTFA